MLELNYDNLNGWAISEEAIKWMIANIPEGSTVLEFGSGNGTIELAKFFDVISVDNDKEWSGLTTKAKYIVTPIIDNWFQMDAVYEAIKGKDIAVVIVDAPLGSGNRKGFIKYAKEFSKSVIIVDDTHRSAELKLAVAISKIVGRPNQHIVGHEKAFATYAK